MLNVSIRQLRSFVVAAKHLSFARAAEELHLTAPAISMQIRDLEAAVGAPVFERQARSIVLTTTGEYLVVYARRVLATLKDAEDTLARLRGVQAGRVTVGMVGTVQYFLPKLLAQFRAAYPGVEVRFTVANRDQLLAQLREREIDLAVMGRPPDGSEARAEPFAANLLGVIAGADHPLAGETGILPARLDHEQFIAREPGSGTRTAMEAFFKAMRISPPTIMQMASNETIKQAVIAGMGLTVLSLHTLALERAAGQLVVLDVAGTPLVRAWHVVHPGALRLSPAAEAFRSFVLERGEALLGELFPLPAPEPVPEPVSPAGPQRGSSDSSRSSSS